LQVELKDFIAGALEMDGQELLLEQLIVANEVNWDKEQFSERLYKDMELVLDMAQNLLDLSKDECDQVRKLIAKYCLYSYCGGRVYGTTTCYKELI
jgi:hypothetical protein